MRLLLAGIAACGVVALGWKLSEIAREERARRTRREHHEQIRRLMVFFEHHAGDPPRFFKAAALGHAMGISGDQAGHVMQDLLGFYGVKGCGYPSEDIYARIDAINAGIERNGSTPARGAARIT